MSKYGTPERSFNRNSGTTKASDNRSRKPSDSRRSSDGFTQAAPRRSSSDSYKPAGEHRSSSDSYKPFGDRRSSSDNYSSSGSRYESSNAPRSSADKYVASREHRPSSSDRYQSSDRYESSAPRRSSSDRYEQSPIERYPSSDGYKSEHRPSSDRYQSSDRYDSSAPRRSSSDRYESSGEQRRSSGSSSDRYSSSSSAPRKSSPGAPFGRSRPSFSGSRPSGGHGGSYSNNKQGARPIKKFNPSDFIRKVEEQVVAPTYVPKHGFADFLMADQLKRNIIKRGYVTPTPIQDQAIPFLLEQKDLIGTANTGTGKTAAFLLPLVSNMITKKTNRVLIITPTRELAAQIQGELDYFKEGTGFNSVLCIGGLSINFQINRLSRNPEFVIGTPGRLKDLEQGQDLNLSKFDAVVLDEVDTMLDMGFINDIKYLVSKLPAKRHTIFFSATLSREIKMVADSFLRTPITVSVKTRQSAENINQEVIRVTADTKIEILHELLIKPAFTKVIIFARTKRATDKLAKELKARGFEIATIHGDKTQGQRKRALDQFKANLVKVLLATDVVARGIDIDDVSHVINFDLPQSHEDYIHRIGRTGRANKVGQAITFIE